MASRLAGKCVKSTMLNRGSICTTYGWLSLADGGSGAKISGDSGGSGLEEIAIGLSGGTYGSHSESSFFSLSLSEQIAIY